MNIILISGLSGAGKSTALRILEDSGFYCVDNLPLTMLEQLASIYKSYGYTKIAVGVDTRTSPLLDQLPKSIKVLRNNNIDVRAIYLDASDNCLLTRFSETRRKHPLSGNLRTVEECIAIERDLLADISLIAHRIDTSNLSANALRKIIKEFVDADFKQMNIIVQSFGFKYGLPIDSDFVFDVRCLPNPHYDKSIREFNGTQQPIIDFLDKEPSVQNMLNDIYTMTSKWFDEFSSDNRNYLTIAIGCTGGKHRSVYLTEALSQLIRKNFKYNVIARHRQIINQSALDPS
ncbi:MAG: RNase adapter RapZ [Burkholderiales bacterium]|nr:RNase adapter RapZ [Burkholderiales bacterium]